MCSQPAQPYHFIRYIVGKQTFTILQKQIGNTLLAMKPVDCTSRLANRIELPFVPSKIFRQNSRYSPRREIFLEIRRRSLVHAFVTQFTINDQELVNVVFLVSDEELCILEHRSQHADMSHEVLIAAVHFSATLNN